MHKKASEIFLMNLLAKLKRKKKNFLHMHLEVWRPVTSTS